MTDPDWRAARTRWGAERWLKNAGKERQKKAGTWCTFFLSPECESPEARDDLKLIFAQSFHLSDGTNQDETFGIHLLNRKTHNKCSKHTYKLSYIHANIAIEFLFIPIICICKHAMTFSPQCIVCINRCVNRTCITVSWDWVRFETAVTDILIKAEPYPIKCSVKFVCTNGCLCSFFRRQLQ